MKYLVVSPLKPEYQTLKSEFAKISRSKEGTLGKINFSEFSELELVLAQGGRGKVCFAISCSHLLSKFPEIKFVICAGSAGALDEQLKPGDVVAAKSTIEHDFKQSLEETLPRFDGSLDLLSKIEVFSPPNFKLKFGIIASGDEDIVTSQRAQEINEKTNAIAVAWEGAGGARAALHFERPFLEIRAITDLANHQTVSEFKKNVTSSMQNAFTVLQKLLT